MSLPRGRPRRDLATSDVWVQLLHLIASGMSQRSACARPGIPSRDAISSRLRSDPAFAAAYDQACEERAWTLTEDALVMSDGLHREDGRDETGAINRDRLGVDTRKWFAACLNARFANRHVVAGDKNAPVVIEHRDPVEVGRRVAFLLARATATDATDTADPQ